MTVLNTNQTADMYSLEFGFRDVKYTSKSLLINGQPFYCHGYGMHEDVEVRGDADRVGEWVT
jgi:beta-galactosidase/beta-glucuronidase